MDITGRPHRGLLTGAGPGRLARVRGGPGHARLPGPDRVQDRPVGAGPGVPAAARAAGRLRPGRDGRGSAEFIHTVIECAKLAFADREAWYGDPRDTDVPVAELLSPAYAADRRTLVGDSSGELIPGAPGGAGAAA